MTSRSRPSLDQLLPMSTVVDLQPPDSHKPAEVNDPYGRGQLTVINLWPALESHKPIGVNDPYRRDQLGGWLRIHNGVFLVKQWGIQMERDRGLVAQKPKRS